MIAGDHHGREAGGLKGGDRVSGPRPRHIGQRDEPEQREVVGQLLRDDVVHVGSEGTWTGERAAGHHQHAQLLTRELLDYVFCLATSSSGERPLARAIAHVCAPG